MLVLCLFHAEGFAGRLAALAGHASQLEAFTGGVVIDCRSDREVKRAFQDRMEADLRNWRGPIKPVNWKLTKYLPACGHPQFGPGAPRSHLKVAPPIAENALGSTQASGAM